MSPQSTLNVASVVGIGRATLERWLKEEKVPMPETIRIGRRRFRIWTDSEVEAIRRFKAANYNKKPRRKKMAKTKARKSKP